MTVRPDVVAVGYTALDYLAVVPALPGENTKLEIRELEIQGGGPAATAAVTASRLGLSASFIGKASDDPFGERMRMELSAEGVDISRMVLEKGRRSQFAFILVGERTAVRTILWNRGTLSPMAPAEIDTNLVESARGLLVDSLEPSAAEAAARSARSRGIPVVIDAGTLREGVGEMLHLCDHIVASETFAGQISGGKGIDAALSKIASFGPRSSVITLGERGCAALIDGKAEYIKGFGVKGRDTTGAGDVFHGAYMFAVLKGWDIRRSCQFSNAVAAMKCRHLGGRKGIPGVAEAIKFLRERLPDVSFSDV